MKYRWITPDREGRADFTVLEYWIEGNDRIWQEAGEKEREAVRAGDPLALRAERPARHDQTILLFHDLIPPI